MRESTNTCAADTEKDKASFIEKDGNNPSPVISCNLP